MLGTALLALGGLPDRRAIWERWEHEPRRVSEVYWNLGYL